MTLEKIPLESGIIADTEHPPKLRSTEEALCHHI